MTEWYSKAQTEGYLHYSEYSRADKKKSLRLHVLCHEVQKLSYNYFFQSTTAKRIWCKFHDTAAATEYFKM